MDIINTTNPEVSSIIIYIIVFTINLNIQTSRPNEDIQYSEGYINTTNYTEELNKINRDIRLVFNLKSLFTITNYYTNLNI